MHDLMGNPIFWIFGGGTIIALVGILAELAGKVIKMREKERAARLRADAQAEADLFGWVTVDEFNRLRARVDALEAEMGQPKGPPEAVKRVRTLNQVEVAPEVEDELTA